MRASPDVTHTSSGSLSNNDGDGYKNVTSKVNSHRFKLYRAYSISFTSSNVGKCFWSWILKDCTKVQEKKRKLLSCVPSSTKREFRHFHVVVGQWRQRNVRKKRDRCTCKVVVLLCRSRCRPRKLPIISFPSCPKPLFQSEANCEVKMRSRWYENVFFSYSNKTHLHKKGFALRLVLKEKVLETRKWPFVLGTRAELKRRFVGGAVILQRHFLARIWHRVPRNWTNYKHSKVKRIVKGTKMTSRWPFGRLWCVGNFYTRDIQRENVNKGI